MIRHNKAAECRAKFVALAVALALLLQTACNSTASDDHDDGHDNDEGASVTEVSIDSAQISEAGIRISAATAVKYSTLRVTGTITYDATRMSHAGTQSGGRVSDIHAELGDRVRKGQMLALLESVEVGATRAELSEAVELAKIAGENYSREQRLAEQGISSRKELLDAEAEYRRQQARVKSAETRLKLLGAGGGAGGQFSLSSPMSGTVVARAVGRGEVVSAQDTLFTVADLSRVWIELNIFERDLGKIQRGQQASITTVAYPGRTFDGKIAFIGATLDSDKRTAVARIEIVNSDGLLKPGMFAEAAIQTAGSGEAMVVLPVDAVQDVGGKTVVFVPGHEAGHFTVQAVEVGEILPNATIVIRKGIAEGAAVVTHGAFVLRSELERDNITGHGH